MTIAPSQCEVVNPLPVATGGRGGMMKKIRRGGAEIEWEMRDSVFDQSFPFRFLCFWGDGNLDFLGMMGIDKWPAHSVRFSRRLERMEEVKIRRGVRREREKEVKASRDETRKRARRDASNGPMASLIGRGQSVG